MYKFSKHKYSSKCGQEKRRKMNQLRVNSFPYLSCLTLMQKSFVHFNLICIFVKLKPRDIHHHDKKISFKANTIF